MAMIQAQTGCLLPPPVEEEVLAINHAPRILNELLTPHPTSGPKQIFTQDCPPTQFYFSVGDDDPQDVIYWRVFINYYLNRAEVLAATEVRTIVQGVTPPLVNFNIDANDPMFNTPLLSGIPDQIELFVSDRPFLESVQEPAGRLAEEDGLTDSFIWTVYRSNEACPVGGAEP